jgi:DNA polymerase-3 subunit beta
MKFQILQENLSKALSVASRFASSKAQLPILGNILLSTKKSKVYVSSTNLEISASVQVGAKIEEEGEISVPAKVITELVSNLPKETISLSAEKEQLKVSTTGFSSKILGINPSDFPKIPTSISEEESVKLSWESLASSLSQVLFATSTDETRPVLTGVLFLFSGESLSLVATDGFRLSRKMIPLKVKKESVGKIVIPKGVLGEITRSEATDSEILMFKESKEKQVIFGVGDIILASRLLEGEYPDFEKIIPRSASVKVLLDKEEFLRAIRLASIFARESANIVRIKVLDDLVKVLAESSAAGSQETKVDAKVEKEKKEDFEIAFNYKFLEDFLHSVVGDEIEMRFTGVSSAGVFLDPKDSAYLHLIMPVKIQD